MRRGGKAESILIKAAVSVSRTGDATMVAGIYPRLPKAEVFYPERDDEPLGETDAHALETSNLFSTLLMFFRKNTQVYVAMDNFLYYEEGNPKACISPDVYVVKGVSNARRDTYKVWDEQDCVPAVVFEFTSKSSRFLDLGKKKDICEKLHVAEYFLFDPIE